MFEIKEHDVSIIGELEKLQTKMLTAREGKDPNCKMCDEAGNIQVSRKSFYGDSMSEILKNDNAMINVKCDCYSFHKSRLDKVITKLLILQKQFRAVFKLSEHERKEIEGLTLSSYAKMFNMDNKINSVKKWLNYGMPSSLFLTGKPGTGKTTTLKMLWQIMVLNSYSCYFFDCFKFENMCLNMFHKNADDSLQREVNKMVRMACSADLLLMDEHASINSNLALIHYFEIINARSESKKPVVIVSNKTFGEVMMSYNSKETKESMLMRDKLYSRLVERLKITELTFEKLGVKEIAGAYA